MVVYVSRLITLLGLSHGRNAPLLTSGEGDSVLVVKTFEMLRDGGVCANNADRFLETHVSLEVIAGTPDIFVDCKNMKRTLGKTEG